MEIFRLVKDFSYKSSNKKQQEKSDSSNSEEKNKKNVKIYFSINEILKLSYIELNGKIFTFNQELQNEKTQNLNDKQG